MKLLSKIPMAVGFVALVLCGGPLFARGAAACGGYDDLLVDAIEACPRARELLGEDIGPSMYGVACGSTETGGGDGRASWTMPFSGSRDRGSLDFAAGTGDDGRWRLRRALLQVGDETIDLRKCVTEAR